MFHFWNIIGGMTMQAVGAYIATLREARGINPTALGRLVGTSASQISRIEQGSQDPRASLLFAIIDAVQGRYDDVQRLLLTDADVNTGHQLAEALLTDAENERIDVVIDNVADAELVAIIREMREDLSWLEQQIGERTGVGRFRPKSRRRRRGG